MRGHNSAYNAGVFGKEMGCRVVALNHFGSASSGKDYVSSMVSEAHEGNKNASQIIATYDFLEIFVPRGGFDFVNTAIEGRMMVAGELGIEDQIGVNDTACDKQTELDNMTQYNQRAG